MTETKCYACGKECCTIGPARQMKNVMAVSLERSVRLKMNVCASARCRLEEAQVGRDVKKEGEKRKVFCWCCYCYSSLRPRGNQRIKITMTTNHVPSSPHHGNGTSWIV